ncbi:MAG TPA: hypothetical protein VF618_21975 [Thermoanaerobaculia bacterium]
MDEKDFQRLLEANTAQILAHFNATTAEIRSDFRELRREFTALDEKFNGLRGEFNELRREFTVMRDTFGPELEFLRHQVEGLSEAVALVNERLTRETADIRDEMRRGFADTHALIQRSHGSLDRRVTALEAKFQ